MVLNAALLEGYPLTRYVTKGAKLYPGLYRDSDRSIFDPVLGDHEKLAKDIKARLDKVGRKGQLQLSFGFDTGTGFYQHRASFISWALFVGSADLEDFEDLSEAPLRDPGATYGLVINGINVTPLNPINTENRRLDYVLTVSPKTRKEEINRWIQYLEFLNLGLMFAVAEDAMIAWRGRQAIVCF